MRKAKEYQAQIRNYVHSNLHVIDVLDLYRSKTLVNGTIFCLKYCMYIVSLICVYFT